MLKHCWQIIEDHTKDPEPNRYNVMYGNATLVEVLEYEPRLFRLYDDDGILYYTGIMRGDIDDELVGFAPLDWGMVYGGCTRIDYKQEDGSWETL